MIGRHIAKYGEYEPQLTDWIAKFLASRMSTGIVVDVGANMGWHTLHAARALNVSRVIACEPDAFNVSLLERNLAANGVDNVVVAPWAIGAVPGHAHLYRYKASNLVRHSLLADYGFGARAVSVNPLDATLEKLGAGSEPIHLLKIDVEGYEIEVIRGARKSLARTAAIVLEFSPRLMRSAGISAKELIDCLFEARFTPFALGHDGTPVALDRQRLAAIEGQIGLIWRKPD